MDPMIARVNFSSEAWRFICVWIASTALIFIDVFGIGDAQRRISQDLFYDVAAIVIEPQMRPPIVTVLATDGDLANLQASWPLSHALQGEVLSEIAAYRPAALFVDILFLDVRDPAATNALLESLKDFDTPVLLASPWDGASAPPPPDSLAFYARAKELGASVVDARYMQLDGTTVALPGGDTEPLPAGLAVRDIYCQQADCAPLEKRRSKPTEIAWRGTPAGCVTMEGNAREACEQIPRSWPMRLLTRFYSSLFPALAPQPLVYQGLLPFETITLSDLLLADDPGVQLTDAVVFYGQSFRAASDVVQSPVYGAVGGVMAHAAHFDDLASRGDRKFIPERPFGVGSMVYEACLIGLLCLAMTSARLVFQTRARAAVVRPDGTLSESRLHFLTAVAVGSTAFVVLICEAALLRTTPEHWLVAFGVIALDSYVPWTHLQNEIRARLNSVRRYLRGKYGRQ